MTTETTLTPGEIEACREALRLSDANIETHIANALCDMALEAFRFHNIAKRRKIQRARQGTPKLSEMLDD